MHFMLELDPRQQFRTVFSVNLYLNGYTSYPAGSPRSGHAPFRGDTLGVPMKMNSGGPGDSEIVFLANHSVRPKAKLVETT